MRSGTARIGASLVAVALVGLASAGCGAGGPTRPTPKAVTHSQLVGRWDGDRDCGSPVPVIRLRDDYTFSAKDVPVAWDGPVPDAKVTRLSLDGKWHAVNKDPGLTPYLVLGYENEHKFLPFYLEHGELRMSGSVVADGGDPYTYPCHYRRTSADPDFGR
ncbi:hypothetical protein [Streptomyces sp. NPDC127092]|uniref:hypothetical protein n=1 Tax=Streptomyces sp. NPDC127092 TaxID=3347135 RepID=UPI00364CFC08